MDNIGYNNWSSRDMNELSSTESPPTYSSKSRKRDEYSYDLEDSDEFYPSTTMSTNRLRDSTTTGRATADTSYSASTSYKKRDQPTRRMSTDERMQVC